MTLETIRRRIDEVTERINILLDYGLRDEAESWKGRLEELMRIQREMEREKLRKIMLRIASKRGV